MNNKEVAKIHLNSSSMTLNDLLREIERDNYTTIDQVRAYISVTLKANEKLAGDQHE